MNSEPAPKSYEFPISSKRVWVVNPFDQLPNETDVPIRYWTLCRILAEQGHEVIWWSSDFSHLRKTKRRPCPDTDGFSIRLIETPTYRKNISLARLRNHRAFAQGFHDKAMDALQSEELAPPDRIVVSLPPLQVADSTFKIRDWVNRRVSPENRSCETGSVGALNSQMVVEESNRPHPTATPEPVCQVIVDVQDAWPENFYQVLPSLLRKQLGSVLLAPLHQSARRAYTKADKISAVGQSYLNLAQEYLQVKSTNKKVPSISKPTHLCHLGSDLPDRSSLAGEHGSAKTLNIIYVGSMGFGYDLDTLLKVVLRWKVTEHRRFHLHLCGTGTREPILRRYCQEHGLQSDLVHWHGYLGRDALHERLLEADLAFTPNKNDSLVACPNKACNYAAYGLPNIFCLRGELKDLLQEWDAGTHYEEGDVESLHVAFDTYANDLTKLTRQSEHSRKLAENLFDREKSYVNLANFIVNAH